MCVRSCARSSCITGVPRSYENARPLGPTSTVGIIFHRFVRVCVREAACIASVPRSVPISWEMQCPRILLQYSTRPCLRGFFNSRGIILHRFVCVCVCEKLHALNLRRGQCQSPAICNVLGYCCNILACCNIPACCNILQGYLAHKKTPTLLRPS